VRPDELERRLQARLDAQQPAPALSGSTSSCSPTSARAERIGSYYGNRGARLDGNRTWGRSLQGFLHSHDGEIATES
jgi:hypothetical protein